MQDRFLCCKPAQCSTGIMIRDTEDMCSAGNTATVSSFAVEKQQIN